MSAQALVPQTEYQLKVIGGPDAGAVYRLLSAQVRIGRGSDNDIALKDLTVSRHHAVIQFSQMGAMIKNMSDKSPVHLNGKPTQEAFLNDQDQVQMGESVLQFVVVGGAASNLPSTRRASGSPGSGSPQSGRSKKSKKPKSNSMFSIVVVAAVLFFAWILNDTSAKKRAGIKIGETVEIQKNVEKMKREEEATLKIREQSGVKSPDYQKAQINYVKGRRDYDNGNFNRAIDSFNGCLTTYPQHAQCRRYLTLASRSLDQVIQNDMRVGRDHRANKKYRECEAIFNRLIYVIGDAEDKRYIEAKNNRDECARFLEDMY